MIHAAAGSGLSLRPARFAAETEDGMRRLRARIAGLEAHAHQTMDSGQALIELASDLVKDLQDGVTVEFEVFGLKIPVKIRIEPDDE